MEFTCFRQKTGRGLWPAWLRCREQFCEPKKQLSSLKHQLKPRWGDCWRAKRKNRMRLSLDCIDKSASVWLACMPGPVFALFHSFSADVGAQSPSADQRIANRSGRIEYDPRLAARDDHLVAVWATDSFIKGIESAYSLNRGSTWTPLGELPTPHDGSCFESQPANRPDSNGMSSPYPSVATCCV